MKITYINSHYAPEEVGGAERSVRFLAEAMVKNGHEVQVIALGAQQEQFDLNGVKVSKSVCANIYNPASTEGPNALKKLLWHSLDTYNKRAQETVGKLLDAFKPDIVHTNNLSGFSVSAWDAAKARKLPIIHTLRDYYLLCPNTAMFSGGTQCKSRCGKCRVLSLPKEKATALVDAVVGNSQFILQKHTSNGLFDDASKHTIYNAYEPKIVEDTAPDDAKVIGYIGRLAPSKGIDTLISAVRLLANEHKATPRVIIAGSGDPKYTAQLKEMAQGLPIKFIGRVNPEAFYNQVHWTAVTSVWDEPLARVLFESFAHGRPVIASETGGTPELTRHGVNGYVYQDAQSAASLAAQIDLALRTSPDAYAQMSRKCTEQARSFTPEQTYSNYLSLYNDLLKQKAVA